MMVPPMTHIIHPCKIELVHTTWIIVNLFTVVRGWMALVARIPAIAERKTHNNAGPNVVAQRCCLVGLVEYTYMIYLYIYVCVWIGEALSVRFGQTGPSRQQVSDASWVMMGPSESVASQSSHHPRARKASHAPRRARAEAGPRPEAQKSTRGRKSSPGPAITHGDSLVQSHSHDKIQSRGAARACGAALGIAGRAEPPRPHGSASASSSRLRPVAASASLSLRCSRRPLGSAALRLLCKRSRSAARFARGPYAARPFCGRLRAASMR